ncbi:uncharacterized protein BCR38DRAFT_305053, partial [Pseudomassariella vexata]
TAWQGPHACYGDFCVYSKPDFSGGRGIVVISLKKNAEAISMLPVLSEDRVAEIFQSQGVNVNFTDEVNTSPPLFRATAIPGKGIGLVATQPIRRGQRIMAYTPAIVVHRKFIDDLSKDEQYRLLEAGIGRLPMATRDIVMAQMGHSGDHRVLDIMMTNSFEMWMDIGQDGHHFGNFPEVSRYNHDCRPNVVYYIDGDLTHYTHAVRDIQPGEELAISYVDSFRVRSVRQDRAQRSWGFKCTCSSCSLPEPLANASDNRLWRIYEVENQIGDWNAKFEPEAIELLLSLYQQERLHESHSAGVLGLVALNYNAFGKQELAIKYALLALEAELIENGPKSRGVQSMLLLLEEPKAHWSWRKRI